MTPPERAKKIAKEYCEGEFTSEKYGKFIRFLTVQIEEVEREAYKAGCDEAVLKFFDDKNKARAEALEEAAKVAEKRDQCPEHISIAYEIRLLKEKV